MDQQAARAVATPQQQHQDAWTAWRRPAVTAAMFAGLGVGLLAMPTPEGLSGTRQREPAVVVGLWSSEALPTGWPICWCAAPQAWRSNRYA
jgi:hypothetical protein